MPPTQLTVAVSSHAYTILQLTLQLPALHLAACSQHGSIYACFAQIRRLVSPKTQHHFSSATRGLILFVFFSAADRGGGSSLRHYRQPSRRILLRRQGVGVRLRAKVTYYRCRSECGDMKLDEVKRLKELAVKDARLQGCLIFFWTS